MLMYLWKRVVLKKETSTLGKSGQKNKMKHGKYGYAILIYTFRGYPY